MKDVVIQLNEIEKLNELDFENFSRFSLLQIQLNRKNICMVYPKNVLSHLKNAEDVECREGIRYYAGFKNTPLGFETPTAVIGKSYDYELLLKVLRIILKQ